MLLKKRPNKKQRQKIASQIKKAQKKAYQQMLLKEKEDQKN